jgi:hypothetical protein
LKLLLIVIEGRIEETLVLILVKVGLWGFVARGLHM